MLGELSSLPPTKACPSNQDTIREKYTRKVREKKALFFSRAVRTNYGRDRVSLVNCAAFYVIKIASMCLCLPMLWL